MYLWFTARHGNICLTLSHSVSQVNWIWLFKFTKPCVKHHVKASSVESCFLKGQNNLCWILITLIYEFKLPLMLSLCRTFPYVELIQKRIWLLSKWMCLNGYVAFNPAFISMMWDVRHNSAAELWGWTASMNQFSLNVFVPEVMNILTPGQGVQTLQLHRTGAEVQTDTFGTDWADHKRQRLDVTG